MGLTEEELVIVCNAAKSSLYLRTMLHGLQLEKISENITYEDNNGAFLIENTQRLTCHTRNMYTSRCYP